MLIWSAPFFLIETYAVTVLMVDRQPCLSLLLTTVHLAAVIVLLPLLTASLGAMGAAWSATTAGLLGALMSLGLVWYRVCHCCGDGKLLLIAVLLIAILLLLYCLSDPAIQQ
ncbi:MAG: hypothetical protein R2911_06520 [Caldilineaceae bacterium]